MYPAFVTALKAHVVNGKIVVDEPVDLPDGSEVRVTLPRCVMQFWRLTS